MRSPARFARCCTARRHFAPPPPSSSFRLASLRTSPHLIPSGWPGTLLGVFTAGAAPDPLPALIPPTTTPHRTTLNRESVWRRGGRQSVPDDDAVTGVSALHQDRLPRSGAGQSEDQARWRWVCNGPVHCNDSRHCPIHSRHCPLMSRSFIDDGIPLHRCHWHCTDERAMNGDEAAAQRSSFPGLARLMTDDCGRCCFRLAQVQAAVVRALAVPSRPAPASAAVVQRPVPGANMHCSRPGWSTPFSSFFLDLHCTTQLSENSKVRRCGGAIKFRTSYSPFQTSWRTVYSPFQASD